MKKLYPILLYVLMFASCQGPEPRRPVSQKSGSFLRESIDRNKQLLAQEEELFKKWMAADTTKKYLRSPNGYWYYYEVRDTAQTNLPSTGDIVLITYSIRTLENDTLYSEAEIGNINFKIDKEEYFPGLRTGVKLLKKGEKATFLFPSSLAYGYPGDHKKIGTNEPLVASITLLDILTLKQDSLPKAQTPQQ